MRNLAPRIGSSHRGPSRVPHWKPCFTLSLTLDKSLLSTYCCSVSDIYNCKGKSTRLGGQGVINQRIRPIVVRPKGPDIPGSQQIPLVIILKELPSFFIGHLHANSASLNIGGNSGLERFGDHGQFVPVIHQLTTQANSDNSLFVGCLGVAFQSRSFHHCLTELGNRI